MSRPDAARAGRSAYAAGTTARPFLGQHNLHEQAAWRAAPGLGLAWAAVLLALAAIGQPGAALAAEACKAKRLNLPLKLVGQRAVTTVSINGTPVPPVVASGSFFNMLTESAAAQLKLTMGAPPLDMMSRGLTSESIDFICQRFSEAQYSSRAPRTWSRWKRRAAQA